MLKLFAALSLVVATSLAAATALHAGGGGGGCHEALSDEATSKVMLKESCYSPTVIRVQQGDTVTWTNKDGVLHNVLGAGSVWGNSQTGSNLARAGASFSNTFEAAGIFPYYCSYHPGMIGVVVVGESGSGDGWTTEAWPAGPGAAASPDEDNGAGVPILGVTAIAISAGLALVSSGIARSRRSNRSSS